MKKIKDGIAAILYKIILLSVKLLPSGSGEKHLLLIKNDEIGDYILFRNYLQTIRNHEKYGSYKITLIGNIIWKDLFDSFDSTLVNDVFWLNKKLFQKDLKYRFNFLKKIRTTGFSDVINCIYSRHVSVDDCFVEIINCKQKMGMVSDISNQKRDKKIYTRLIDAGDKLLFDLFRNSNFISQALDINQATLNPSVHFKDVRITYNSEPAYCVVFAGAGKQSKKWPPEYFADIIKYISTKYNLNVYLGGGPGDIADSNAVKEIISVPVIDLTGKLTMSESLSLLKSAKFALSVDTGSVHMAAGVLCPVIALYSGIHYRRFAPYPKEVFNKFYYIYCDEVDNMIHERSPKLSDPSDLTYTLIRKIPPSKVIPYIDNILQNKI